MTNNTFQGHRIMQADETDEKAKKDFDGKRNFSYLQVGEFTIKIIARFSFSGKLSIRH